MFQDFVTGVKLKTYNDIKSFLLFEKLCSTKIVLMDFTLKSAVF